MADSSVKKALENALADLVKKVQQNNTDIHSLSNDGDYLYFRSRMNILAGAGKLNKADSHGNAYWADGSGTIWSDATSNKQYNDASHYVQSIDSHIAQLQAENAELQKPVSGKIAMAQKALDDYNTGTLNTPEQQQALAKINYSQANTKYIIIAGIVIVIIIVGAVIIFKFKKGTQTAAA